jgi:hypothetical protein
MTARNTNMPTSIHSAIMVQPMPSTIENHLIIKSRQAGMVNNQIKRLLEMPYLREEKQAQREILVNTSEYTKHTR